MELEHVSPDEASEDSDLAQELDEASVPPEADTTSVAGNPKFIISIHSSL